jgi:uroporphyrinogen III methyltransferase/synthase
MVEFAFLTKVVAGLKRVKRAWWIGDGRGLSRERGGDALPQDALRSRKPGPENGSFGVEDAGDEAADRPGRVYIVGAGPGDPGLLTLKGKRCLEEADIIVYDYLVNEDIVAHGRPDAERVRLGKPGSTGRLSQEAINRLLVRHAGEGKVVVRLKGGDPFIFSRGGEEAEALAGAGVAFEIVPGVTSAIAVPSYAGIPLTHRHMASSVAFVTGHEDSTKESSGIDWKAVAGMGTVVFLMGVSRLSQIVARLVEEGRAPETPVAVIEWGTWPGQRTVTGTLQDIRESARGMRRPAVIVVGEVVRLRKRLEWFKELPASRRATEARRQQEAAPTKALKA